jgi:hypothetical protein
MHSLGVAKGPFNATVFFLIDLMASSGIEVLPFLRIGVTSTSSHLMGTCEDTSVNILLRAWVSSFRLAHLGDVLKFTCDAHLGGRVDVLDTLTDLGADTVTWNKAPEREQSHYKHT